MLKNFICSVIIILSTSYVFASDKNYGPLIKRQSEQIKELSNRLELLEQAMSSLTSKTRPQPANNLEQDPNLLPLPEKKVFFDDKTAEANSKSEYDLALALLKDGKFDDAELKFADFIHKYPKHNFRENALFWYAESFYRRDNFNQAAIDYLKAYKEYPKGSKASDALLKLALSLGALDKSKEACSILEKLGTEFPNRPANSIKRAGEAKEKFGCGK